MLKFKNIYKLLIQVKQVPNPNFLKFIPIGKQSKRCLMFTTCLKPIQHNGVTREFYGMDYISISKKNESKWDDLRSRIFEQIFDQYESNQEGSEKQFLFEGFKQNKDSVIQDDDSKPIQLIKDILNHRIRPDFQEIGGDIVFREFDELNGILYLYKKGSCVECPATATTLKNRFEKMLCQNVDQVKQVIAEDYVGYD
ncbi:unnamed protein product (macronuclear) [Paramecium tetraurelia]|uniref:Scaffold protein Nfu/NifU N-terminal domain-containing protein n=1 Tax=Paramecium tetraurelia TaxID=5888 RepID=A0E5L7_PARTE|nr:uncharacterized protein GSPATT00003445001 [Paramecium tetraurelia]CAK90584.1 unnamed protein product [Paramecium tetraurelia]|eukprot:XP_001457981.1 hypothetical protein (macronuclear) [Paramecium tetraurelia strain d4-2]